MDVSERGSRHFSRRHSEWLNFECTTNLPHFATDFEWTLLVL